MYEFRNDIPQGRIAEYVSGMKEISNDRLSATSNVLHASVDTPEIQGWPTSDILRDFILRITEIQCITSDDLLYKIALLSR